MSLSFKNRIAFHYLVATAIIMAIVFGIIYFLVRETALQNIDKDLSYEAKKHIKEIELKDGDLQFINKEEWEEREHREIQVNPSFIQIMDLQGAITDKSPNLKQDQLAFKDLEFDDHFNTKLHDIAIRQVQRPIEKNGKVYGYIIVAMSSESAFSVISRLRNVLILSFFFILIGLYYISRFLAGKSIVPVQEITNTITRITQNNLNERVSLPQEKDELYTLSASFNALLERIESALEREKQFTSDASHELRTPLTTLRGTLEVLIRKPRTQEEYEGKIKYSLHEIDRMTAIIEQLLLLARLESSPGVKDKKLISLTKIIDESIIHFQSKASEKNIQISNQFNISEEVLVPHYYTNMIMDNILSNAIKYSEQGGVVAIVTERVKDRIKCIIKDDGIGIKQEDMANIYKGFYRSDALLHKHITGNGLGLSIAKKCADAINADLEVASSFGHGTTVTISF